MVIVGVWHVLVDIIALANDKIYVSAPNTIYSYDLTGWGWIHLLAGILVAAAVGVLHGQTWAGGRDRAGVAEHGGELSVHAVVSVVVSADHRAGYHDHLDAGGIPARTGVAPPAPAHGRRRQRVDANTTLPPGVPKALGPTTTEQTAD